MPGIPPDFVSEIIYTESRKRAQKKKKYRKDTLDIITYVYGEISVQVRKEEKVRGRKHFNAFRVGPCPAPART